MTIETLLNRLQRVRQTGTDRWIAPCPAHEDKSPSLSIRVTSDGVILFHCFGGCDSEAILHALGLTFADLYPERLAHHVRPSKSRIPASDLLLICDDSIFGASILAADFLEKKAISEADWQRLAIYSQRLGRAAAETRR